MERSLTDHRLEFLEKLNRRAAVLAQDASLGHPITPRIMETINELYRSAKVEQVGTDVDFEAAYHTAITGELEFFIAKILLNYSKIRGLSWVIKLRRQEEKVVPDIRILRSDTTLAIIEIKAKGGWMQPFFSEERYRKDKDRKDNGAKFNPDDLIAGERGKLDKSQRVFNLQPTDIYFLIPTLNMVHRKKYEATLADYQRYFETTSGLPSTNYILLSKNLSLNLSNNITNHDLDPSSDFERMLNELAKK